MTVRPERLSPIQAARKAALLVLVIALATLMLVVDTPLDRPGLHAFVVWTGRWLLATCIVGRCWCILYIGGRKISQLIQVGPYSIMRNPLYTMSFIGAAGVGAQTGSLIVTGLALFTCWIVFRVVVSKEEAFLGGLYGETYARYLQSTPRFLPDLRRWRDVEMIEVPPIRVVMTFIDGLWFLTAIPLTQLAAYLHQAGLVPVLLRLV